MTSQKLSSKPGSVSREWSNQTPVPRRKSWTMSGTPAAGQRTRHPFRCRHRIHAVEIALQEQRPLEIRAEDAIHEQGDEQDADEFTKQELPARDGFAHEGDGGAALDFVADEHAGGEDAEDDGKGFDRVGAEFLDHRVIFAKGEIGDERPGAQKKEADGEQQPEHWLTDALTESRLRDGASLGPDPVTAAGK